MTPASASLLLSADDRGRLTVHAVRRRTARSRLALVRAGDLDELDVENEGRVGRNDGR